MSTPSSGRSRASRPEHQRPRHPPLLEIYEQLDRAYGGETWHWMPGAIDGPLDVVAGAVLVQHTTWTNAERALASLRDAGALTTQALASFPQQRIAELVSVSGTPSVKARRLQAIGRALEEAGGLEAFISLPRDVLRERLLATHGIGPETADAIALYAAGTPAFVIDAYTRRVFRRLGHAPEADSYSVWQRFFEDSLPRDVDLYRRYHAWIVLHAKQRCRATPRCDGCPLLLRCRYGQAGRTNGHPR